MASLRLQSIYQKINNKLCNVMCPRKFYDNTRCNECDNCLQFNKYIQWCTFENVYSSIRDEISLKNSSSFREYKNCFDVLKNNEINIMKHIIEPYLCSQDISCTCGDCMISKLNILDNFDDLDNLDNLNNLDDILKTIN